MWWRRYARRARDWREVEQIVLADHLKLCVEQAIESGDAKDQRKKLDELIAIIEKSDS